MIIKDGYRFMIFLFDETMEEILVIDGDFHFIALYKENIFYG